MMLMLNNHRCREIIVRVRVYRARDLFDFSMGYLSITIDVHNAVELNHNAIHTLVFSLCLSHLVEY
jgi:hypothetical protein